MKEISALKAKKIIKCLNLRIGAKNPICSYLRYVIVIIFSKVQYSVNNSYKWLIMNGRLMIWCMPLSCTACGCNNFYQNIKYN